MFDVAAQAISALTPFLPAIVTGVVDTAEDVAAKTLYTLITEAFRRIGDQSRWDAYTKNPHDSAVVTRVLAAALRGNPEIAQEIERTVTEMNERRTDQRGASVGGDGNIVGGDYASDSHNTSNSHNRTTSNSNNQTRHYGGILAVVAVIAVVAIFAIWGGSKVYESIKGSGLSANSTCAEFLQADQQEELTAIRKIGVAEGVAGVGSPLALPAISYSCSGAPDARLGDIIAKFKGQF
jgi:hypothetical protein